MSRSTSAIIIMMLVFPVLGGFADAADPPLGVYDVYVYSEWYFSEEAGDPLAYGWIMIDPNPGYPSYDTLSAGLYWAYEDIESYASGTVKTRMYGARTDVTMGTYPDGYAESEIEAAIGLDHVHVWQTLLGE